MHILAFCPTHLIVDDCFDELSRFRQSWQIGQMVSVCKGYTMPQANHFAAAHI